MDNGDMMRSLTNEQLAEFLANERYNLLKPVFDYLGYGIEKQVVYLKLLSWMNQPFELENENG